MPEVFQVDPLPEMIDQRLSPGVLPNWCIDPTCGRYCLKALLKHHFEKLTGHRVAEVQLPKATGFFGDIIAYDPYDDFPLADQLLKEKYGDHPDTLDKWLLKLKKHGPIIVAGSGVGHASKRVGHFILLVGANSFNSQLYYMDPLRGNDVFKEDFQSMQNKIEGCVYAKTGIGAALARYVQLPMNVANLPFNG